MALADQLTPCADAIHGRLKAAAAQAAKPDPIVAALKEIKDDIQALVT